MVSEVLHFRDKDGLKIAEVEFFCRGDGHNVFKRLDPELARSLGQEPLQIFEDARYEYEIGDRRFRLGAFTSAVIVASQNPNLAHCGIFTPGSFVGEASLCEGYRGNHARDFRA